MHIINIIKRQTLTLIVIVLTLSTFILSVSYILFFEIDNYSESKNDFDISFCLDKSCDKKYYNYNNLIGVKVIDNKVSLKKINNYDNQLYAILETPYIVNIKNNIETSNVAIKLKLRDDYLYNKEYLNYINDIYLAIGSSHDKINVIKYVDIDKYIINDFKINNNEEKIYYIWLFSLNSEYKSDMYFVLEIELEKLN